MKEKQLLLSFAEKRRSAVTPRILVRLGEADLRYLKECVQSERSFTESFLMECRSQRIGCSLSELSAMRNYERSLHLADEAVILRLQDWATTPAMYLDWATINKRAVEAAEQLGKDFAEWRSERYSQQVSVVEKRKRSKPK